METKLTNLPIKGEIIAIRLNDAEAKYELHGHVKLFGAYHHVKFIRVKEGDIVEPLDDCPDHTREIFEDIQRLNEGACHRCTLPGIEGQWVMVIYPFAD